MRGFWDIFSLLCVITGAALAVWCIAHVIFGEPPKREFVCIEGTRYFRYNETVVPAFDLETRLPQRCQP